MDETESSQIPYSNSNFIIHETLNSSLRNIRPSTHVIPLNNDFYKKTGLPLGIYIQPFAERPEEENPIPVVTGRNILNLFYF